ncbi:MAG: AI-2E family transporter [Rhodospirillaceae bacterium]|nr:AI-2E family transporter [Rhodospirillaceae bacterium]
MSEPPPSPMGETPADGAVAAAAAGQPPAAPPAANSPARLARFWLSVLAGVLLLLWLLSSILAPFVAGIIIAYILDPLVSYLERRKVRRWIGSLVLICAVALILLVITVILMPVIINQLIGLLQALPGYFEQLHHFLVENLERAGPALQFLGVEDVGAYLGQNAGRAVSWLGGLAGGVLQSGLALIDLVALIALTPVVAYYFLKDWDRLVEGVDSLVPVPNRETVRTLATRINRTLANFLRGQASVCLILGSFYAIALGIAGLDFGLLVGFGAGVISFIPYLGSILGLLTSVGIAIGQYEGWLMPGVILGIFLVGQAVEGNILTPKLVGDSVELNPVWVMFALLAGGAFLGFAGLMLAVPMAAAIGVVVRFIIERYRGSSYYTGVAPQRDQ